MRKQEDTQKFPWEEADNPFLWIKQAFLAIQRELEAQLRPHGLTVAQWRTLGVLQFRPGLTHTDLEKFMHIEKPSVTSLVRGLVNHGWCIRQTTPDDARIRQVFLTAEGRKKREQTANAKDQALSRLYQTLTPEEIDTVHALLKKIVHAYE